MKKLFILLLVLCIAGVAVVALAGGAEKASEPAVVSETTPEPEATPVPELAKDADGGETPEPAQTAETPAGVDYAAIYALHDPDEVVMTINGEEIPWSEYFYFYHSKVMNMEQQFQMYQYYGYAVGWDSQADEEGHTYAELMGEETEYVLRQLSAIETVAAENNVALTEENEAKLQEEHAENIAYFCGEDATEEDFYAYLRDELYLSPELYWRLNRASMLYTENYNQIFGENGEKLSDEEILAALEEEGVLSANHILIATVDLNDHNYPPLDEETVAQKTELARQIAEELQAIEDEEARTARFLELKEQYCEDGGDFVFVPGVMEPAFYDAAAALEVGQISGPVETSYGYHIILRRALSPDDVVYTGPMSSAPARSMVASTRFNRLMQEALDAQTLSPAEGFTAPDLRDYLTKSAPAE